MEESVAEQVAEAPAAARAQIVAEKIVEKIVERVSASREAAAAPQGLYPEGVVGGHKVYLRTGEYDDGRSARSSSTCTRKAPPSAA
jgi:ribonucleoside-diphosphate reductase alpha chain